MDNNSVPPLEQSTNYPFRLRLLTCGTPGSYAARNTGAAAAQHPVLAFTDADCEPSPEWLAKGLVKLLRDGGESVVGGEVEITAPTPRTAVGLYQYIAGFQQQQNIQRSGFAATANLFCFRQQFDTVGPFDERLLSGGDRDWCWRAQRAGYAVTYEPDAVVRTPPRTSLRAAVRQARRVAAGRIHLRDHRLAPTEAEALSPHRGPLRAAGWIIAHPELTAFERWKVLWAASLIRFATLIENRRLRAGSEPERR